MRSLLAIVLTAELLHEPALTSNTAVSLREERMVYMANDILCPSIACIEGSGRLGIVMPDGKVAISSTLIIKQH
jgi:hypothetical protein